VVYGSLTTAIVVMLSFEIGATLLLLGAQVIAVYENIEIPQPERPPVRIKSYLGQKLASLVKPVPSKVKGPRPQAKRKQPK
jgi:uncharacterized BrkB/YihY/UPF0761 family membrane protein